MGYWPPSRSTPPPKSVIPKVLKFFNHPPSLQTFFSSPYNWKWLLLHFSHMATSNKYIFTFLKLLQLIKCHHSWFVKKLKQYIKETHFYHHTFLFFYGRWLAFHEYYGKNFKTFQKSVSIPRMDEKKLHTREFHLKGISRNMRCKMLQKKSTGKTTSCSKHLNLTKNLTNGFFKISLKYIKLVIPIILFILALCNFKFYFKITCLPPAKLNYPPQQYTPPTKIKVSNLLISPAKTFLKFFIPPSSRECMPW